jgi:hypothetical protein
MPAMHDAPISRVAMEIASLGTIVGTIFEWMPRFAVLLAVVWYVLQIWESNTMRRLLNRKLCGGNHE